MEKKNSLRKFLGIFLAIVLVVGGGYWVWDKFFSETGRARRLAAEQLEIHNKGEKAYIEAMTADTYGGKTPQETLDLFVEALRAGDVELASKYFLLDENLSREKWVSRLEDIKNGNLFEVMADDISNRSQPDLENRIDDNDFVFVLRKDDGNVGARIDMQLNSFSQIWKIESL